MSPESLFSELEIQYLRSQRLARIATVSRQGQANVAPVGFQFDLENGQFKVRRASSAG